jgi:hypothetical protein
MLPAIEITWGKALAGGLSPPPTQRETTPRAQNKTGGALGKAGVTICKTTGRTIKRTTFVWPMKVLLSLMDLAAAPFGFMAGKDINFPILWKVGCGMIILSFWLFVAVDSSAAKWLTDAGMTRHWVGTGALIAKTLFPGLLAFAGACMILGGTRLQQGKSFMAKFGHDLEPPPAFESGVIIRLGDVKLSLRDSHTGIGAFGGVGSGKTVSMMVPLMRQFFRQLNDPDDNSEHAKCGALILDEKGDFIDSTITEMLLAGRSLQDLVIIDPDLDLYRYNPLDPDQSADENAEKLGKVQKILGGGSGGDNKYWDDTSKATIKYFLQLLEVYKPKNKIGLDDVARFMRDDALASVLCDTVEKTLKEKKAANDISEEDFGSYSDAISATRNAWIHLNPNTKSTLKTTIANMLGPIAQNPRLQKVFCRDTNFSFSELPNKGKIVLFRGSGIDKATAKLICVCLKIDFQTWQKRRNGSSAAAWGLNTARTVLFMCDEYQEFVTCGGEGDEAFYGVSRSTRTAPIIATQSYNSLETAIKNKEQTKTLRQNITTWVFFRSTDEETCKLGEFLAGKSKKEDCSSSINKDGLMGAAVNLGHHSGRENTVNVSRKLEENFRADDFSKLVTMTMEKSRSGPWYSEAIVYHYHDIEENAETRCYKTRLTHLYYPKDLRKKAAAYVKHLDWILMDRNWQRKAMLRGMLLIQRTCEKCQETKKQDLMRRGAQEAIKAERSKATKENPKEKERLRQLVENQKGAAKNLGDELHTNGKVNGAINTEESYERKEIEEHIRCLGEELENCADNEKQQIQIQIEQQIQLLCRLKIREGITDEPPKKFVVRASSIDEIGGERPEEEDENQEQADPGAALLGTSKPNLWESAKTNKQAKVDYGPTEEEIDALAQEAYESTQAEGLLDADEPPAPETKTENQTIHGENQDANTKPVVERAGMPRAPAKPPQTNSENQTPIAEKNQNEDKERQGEETDTEESKDESQWY